MGGLTLITGGARAGKTAFALDLARATGAPVLYVATAEGRDDEMIARIARHRAERPPAWGTLEEPFDVAGALARVHSGEAVLLDCLTVWVSNLLLRALPEGEFATARAEAAERAALDAVRTLLDWRRRTNVDLIAVTNEVGLGIVPPSPLARLYRDVLGRVNAMCAREAERMFLVVAGLALDLRAAGALEVGAREYER